MTVDFNELKKGGFLQQKQKDLFLMRIRTLGGNLTSEQLIKIAELADKYGKSYIHLTTRQGAEIPYVHINDYANIKRDVQEMGLLPGTCGPRIRCVISCPGNEVCRYGLMNSRELAVKLDAAFFGRSVPKKTKIAVSGCPNSCAKPQENDIGFIGVIEPVFNAQNCTGCGLCEQVCPAQAISMVDDKPVIDKAKCLCEGNCIASCPSDAWEEGARGFDVYAGGKIGRLPRLGQKVVSMVNEAEVIAVVEKILDVFTKLGQAGERIADLMGRIGLEKFKEELSRMEVKDER